MHNRRRRCLDSSVLFIYRASVDIITQVPAIFMLLYCAYIVDRTLDPGRSMHCEQREATKDPLHFRSCIKVTTYSIFVAINIYR